MIIVIHICVIVTSSLVSSNAKQKFQFTHKRTAISSQWRCDSKTEYHQIKNNFLNFFPIVINF